MRESPDRRRTGRPATVDSDDVLRAAVRLVRSEGFAALSMRRLGSELGVDAMVAYRLFASKETLLDAAYRYIVAASEPVSSGDPITDVMVAFGNFWHDLVEHPGLVPLMTPRMLATEAAMEPFEWVMARLVDAGLTVDTALTWYTTLLSFVLGSVAIHPNVQQRQNRIDPNALPSKLYPIISAIDRPIDHEHLFTTGLERLELRIRNDIAEDN
ncbi:TetR/AcrR family transcriptional regulator [Mycobacterium sp.]|uniref:TetR/AcrR family transcriptional regulator n=1 Tax=Mycobacterium sp. TaxID=1785 RepID=UPI003BA9775D